jgi:hypothetical protein
LDLYWWGDGGYRYLRCCQRYAAAKITGCLMGLLADHTKTRRPLAMTLLASLYLFFLLVSASTFGNPFPFLGQIYHGTPAKFLVLADSVWCLYLVLGLMQQQSLTWYLLLAYNLLQIGNTLSTLNFISLVELESLTEGLVNRETLWVNNMVAALGMLLLTQYIFRHKEHFPNKKRFLL